MKANGISARSRGVLALAEDAPSITMKAATANPFRACIFIGTSFASSWYPGSDLTDPGSLLSVGSTVKNAHSLPKRRAPHSRLQVYDRQGDAKIFGGYVPDDVKRSPPTYPHGANMLAHASMRAGAISRTPWVQIKYADQKIADQRTPKSSDGI